MSQMGRMYGIIRKVVISEKASQLTQYQQCYAFVVAKDANKAEIKSAVETIFSVDVVAVTTVNVRGKVKRFRGRLGKQASSKKAYVRLAAGQTIELSTS
jgi:large subunit ribosomal protein L23